MLIKEAFEHMVEELVPAYGYAEARSVTRIVFEDAFRVYHFDQEKALSEEYLKLFNSFLPRLLKNEPVQYVLGQADFYGRKFKVNASVLIPRQETEELVHWADEQMGKKTYRVLDIGTGSGCIAITLKKLNPNLEVYALDTSADALTVARENAELLEADINFLEINILDKNQWHTLPKFDCIISNPPYISRAETSILEANVVNYEPHLALFVEGKDDVLFYRVITLFAQQYLNTGGWLFFEVNTFNAKLVQELVKEMNFNAVELREDINGNYRMVKGEWS